MKDKESEKTHTKETHSKKQVKIDKDRQSAHRKQEQTGMSVENTGVQTRAMAQRMKMSLRNHPIKTQIPQWSYTKPRMNPSRNSCEEMEPSLLIGMYQISQTPEYVT